MTNFFKKYLSQSVKLTTVSKMSDVKISFERGTVKTFFSKKFIETLSKNISQKVAEEIYYEMLFARYLPEVEGIERKKLKALKNEEAKSYLKQLLKSK